MRRPRTLVLVAVFVTASCGGTVRASEPTISSSRPRSPASLTSRQRATVCIQSDLGSGTPPLPSYRRLDKPQTPWFSYVQLDPPPNNAEPVVPLVQAWHGIGFSGLYASAIYDVVLAYWTSTDDIVEQANGQVVPHRHVLAWVAIGKHRPVEAVDVDSTHLTRPAVPCYFGTSITAVDATTGQTIADALDYH